MSFEVPSRSSSRGHFTTAQKLEILDEYDKCIEMGSKAQLARAVRVNPRTIYQWFVDRENGCLTSRSDRLNGNPSDNKLKAAEKKQLTQLQAENEALKAKLAKSEAAVDILGKASALLEAMSKSADATDPTLPEVEATRPDWMSPPQ
jgi:transposase